MEVSRNQRRKMNTEKTSETVTPMVVGLDRKVIRQILEDEIRSHYKAAEQNAYHKQFEDAYKMDAIRQGLSHALFVLALKCGV